ASTDERDALRPGCAAGSAGVGDRPASRPALRVGAGETAEWRRLAGAAPALHRERGWRSDRQCDRSDPAGGPGVSAGRSALSRHLRRNTAGARRRRPGTTAIAPRDDVGIRSSPNVALAWSSRRRRRPARVAEMFDEPVTRQPRDLLERTRLLEEVCGTRNDLQA